MKYALKLMKNATSSPNRRAAHRASTLPIVPKFNGESSPPSPSRRKSVLVLGKLHAEAEVEDFDDLRADLNQAKQQQ